MELRPLRRVVHGILSLHHAKFEEKAVLRIFDPLQEGVLAVFLYKLIGILLGPQVDHFSFNPRLFQDADRSQGRPYTGSVAVIGQQHLPGVSLKECCLPFREGSAQRCDRFVKAGLMHGDDVHVPLAQDLVRRLRSFGNVQSVQVPALVENLCLGRVEVLGLCVPHDAPAETDHLSPHVHDGEDDAVPEFVVHSPLLVEGGDARLEDHVVGKALAAQVGAQVISRTVGVPQAEIAHRGRIQLSLRQVPESFYSFLRPQQLVVVDGRLFVDRS